MDIESAAKYWWIQEFSTNGDAFVTSSTYLYKARNGKLYWGPLWDFDLALSNMETDTVFNNTQMPWLDHLRAYEPDYQKVLRDEWDRFDKILKDVTKKDGVLDSYAAEIRSSWKNDSVAYKHLYSSENPTYEEADKEFTEAVEKLRTYIDSRRIAIENSIGTGPHPDGEKKNESSGSSDSTSSTVQQEKADSDPDTGDNSNPGAWLAVMLSSALALTLIGSARKKAR